MALGLNDARAVIEHISNGASLILALELVGATPGQFRYAMDIYPSLLREYVRAQELRAHLHADEIIGIADTDTDPQRARNRIDARKWHASKMNSRVYGERLDVNMQGTIDLAAIVLEARQRTVQQSIEYQEVKSIEHTDTGSVPSIWD